MQTKPYDWLLFDADNTLFDFTAAERASLQAALEEEGVAFHADLHTLYHRINRECWADFEHGRIGKEQLRRERFVRFFLEIGVSIDPEAFAAAYLGYLAGAGHLLPGAQTLLEVLRPNYQLGLITNGLKEVQRPRLQASRLTAYFAVVVVSDEIGPAKPHADFFAHTFAEMGHPPTERVLVIGDNLHADIQGGLDYGTHTCWYNPDGTKAHLPVQPTYEVKSFAELQALLGG